MLFNEQKRQPTDSAKKNFITSTHKSAFTHPTQFCFFFLCSIHYDFRNDIIYNLSRAFQ